MQRRTGFFSGDILFIFIFFSILTSNAAFSKTMPQARDQLMKSKPTIGVYYYPWYASAASWDSSYSEKMPRHLKWNHAMRLHLIPPQQPKAGLYDSRDPKLITEHLTQSKRGAIDFWAVSWWGPGHYSDIAFKDHILKHPDAGQLKYAILYESTGRFRSFDDPNYAGWMDDLAYLKKTYFDHPHYYKIDGRPVIFVYLTREYFRNKGDDALARMRKKYPQIYLVADDVFSATQSNGYKAEWAAKFDAVTAYDVYGQSSKRFGNTSRAIDFLASTYRHAKTAANSVGTAFMPTIAPGYNDTAVRKGHPPRARYVTDTMDYNEGDVFRAMISKVALPNLDEKCGNVMMITSFNEWYEDTQIEATTGNAPPSDSDDSPDGTYYTGGEMYYDYEYLYLDILAETTKTYRKN